MCNISKLQLIALPLLLWEAIRALLRVIGALGDVDTICNVLGLPATRCGSGTMTNAILTWEGWGALLPVLGLALFLYGERRKNSRSFVLKVAFDQFVEERRLNDQSLIGLATPTNLVTDSQASLAAYVAADSKIDSFKVDLDQIERTWELYRSSAHKVGGANLESLIWGDGVEMFRIRNFEGLRS